MAPPRTSRRWRHPLRLGFSLCIAALVGASHHQSAPPAHYYEGPGLHTSSWAAAPAHASRPRGRPTGAAVRPFRVVTTASVSVVYALMAWRESQMVRERLARGAASRVMTVVGHGAVVGNVAACFLASARARHHKRLLKAVLLGDLAIEMLLLATASVRALGGSRTASSSTVDLASGISSFWFSLILLTCLRSNWIPAVPNSSSAAAASGTSNPHHHHHQAGGAADAAWQHHQQGRESVYGAEWQHQSGPAALRRHHQHYAAQGSSTKPLF
mmetsp:Transcript_12380/g.49873  ORF Transcript_12380/g.49873 Transcript_12380/m.49873 type:complete len:271 (-) Transcript_12380:1133-1945(-)